MGQAGQYNYGRCIARGETGGAQLAAFEFVKSAIHGIYLLNGAYMPYYKWCFRGLKGLPRLGALADPLEALISTGNEPQEAEKKQALIEAVCCSFADALQDLTGLPSAEMERQAYALNDTIADPTVRNLHILCGV